jgi:hypothetical protein
MPILLLGWLRRHVLDGGPCLLGGLVVARVDRPTNIGLKKTEKSGLISCNKEGQRRKNIYQDRMERDET